MWERIPRETLREEAETTKTKESAGAEQKKVPASFME